MPKLQVRKKMDASIDGFNETVEYTVLMQSDVQSNHNKFYAIELQKNPDSEYRIFTHYGRLGISNVYEARETLKGDSGPIKDISIVKKEYDDIVKKKQKGKKNKDTGEREAYVIIDTVAPTVGSLNIRNKSEVTKNVTIKESFDTTAFDPKVAKLIDQLIEENVHNITTNTSIKYTANGYATELGPVTSSHVAKARVPLDEINKLLISTDNLDPDEKNVQRLNSQYFSLIPKPFSRKISSDDMILDSNQLQIEYDILSQLETAVTMGSAMQGNTSQRINALGTDINILNDLDEVRRIKRYIRNSKASNHQGLDVWKYDVKTIFKVHIPDERSRYNIKGKKKGNIKEVFHGSSSSNCLSIIKGGLIIPPTKAGHVTGRLNGDAIYGAIQSTKAMNYCTGFWGGRRSKYNNIFIFIVDFAMGRIYETVSSTPNGLPKGYDSVWAKPGYLYNHELMVYKLEQQTIKYIVEMTPGGK